MKDCVPRAIGMTELAKAVTTGVLLQVLEPKKLKCDSLLR